MANEIFKLIGRALAAYLTKPLKSYRPAVNPDIEKVKRILQTGDVILVEGELRVSSAIKYLTQSTWSHAAMYVGDINDKSHQLIEADMQDGVRAISLDYYKNFHIRVCRPVGLSAQDKAKLVTYMQSRLGHTYDLDNVIDLMRYLLPTPPVPTRFRRHMLKLGSGEPTQAICSSLIAQAFQSINYPILPIIEKKDPSNLRETAVLFKRHHSLYVPKDFDVSPYFNIIKPSIHQRFDYTQLVWDQEQKEVNNPDQSNTATA